MIDAAKFIGKLMLVHKGPYKGELGTLVDTHLNATLLELQTHKGNIKVTYLDCFPDCAPRAEDTFKTVVGYDPVNKPAHYAADRKYEPIDVIEDWFPDGTPGGYCKSQALRYTSRAGRKEDEEVDLEKAIWYLRRRINQIRKERENGTSATTSAS